MRYHDLQVCVEMNGHRAKEYNPETINGDSARVCWICSHEGEEFVIDVINFSRDFAICCNTQIDGRLVDKATFRPGQNGLVDGQYVDSSTIRPFIFSKFQYTSGNPVSANNGAKLADLGTVRIIARRVADVVDEHIWDNIVKGGGNGHVPENAEGTGTHYVSLGNQRTTGEVKRNKVKYLDTIDKPYCVFEFRYRPQDVLQAEGIKVLLPRHHVPRSRSEPVPSGGSKQHSTPDDTSKGSGQRRKPRRAATTSDDKAAQGGDAQETVIDSSGTSQSQADALAAGIENLVLVATDSTGAF